MADGLHGYAQDPPKPDLEDVPGEPGQHGVPVGQHEQHAMVGAASGPATHQAISITRGGLASRANAQRAKVLQGAIKPLPGTVRRIVGLRGRCVIHREVIRKPLTLGNPEGLGAGEVDHRRQASGFGGQQYMPGAAKA